MAGVQISDWAMVKSMPGQGNMEDRVLPMHLAPPLHDTDGSKGTAGCYVLAPVPSQDRCQNQVETTHGTALGSPTPDFSSGFTPEASALPEGVPPKAATRQWQFFLRVYSQSLCLSLSSHKAVADWWW